MDLFRFFFYSAALALIFIQSPPTAKAACATPTDVTCVVGTELNAAGETWTAGTRYVPSGGKTMTGNITMNGTGVLHVCGPLTLGSNNLDLNNSGNSVTVGTGGSISGSQSVYLDQDATITLYGSITLTNDLVANNDDAAITVAGTGSVDVVNLNLNQDSHLYVVSGGSVAASNTMNVQNTSDVCLEDNVELDITKINNNVTNSFTYGGTGGSKGCIGFTGASTMNNALTASSSILLCEATGSTCTSCNKGSATVESDCASCNSYILPVELLEWTAAKWEQGTLLNWKTASEINNDHFVVEGSFNGWNYFPIEVIDGQGTTSELTSYSTVDYHQYPYYRLVQYDYNGDFYTFNTLSPTDRGKSRVLVQENKSKVWNMTQLIDSHVLDNAISIQIYNTTGQQVNHTSVNPEVAVSGLLDNLTPGYYMAQIVKDGLRLSYRFSNLNY